MHSLDVMIITAEPFPVGNVATNRFSTYAKALAATGIDVTVLILKGTESIANPINVSKAGDYEGVKFEYMAPDTYWNQNSFYLIKIYKYIKGIFYAARRLLKNKNKQIIMYTNDMVYMYIFWMLARMKGHSYYIDKSEYPVVYRKKNGVYRYLFLKGFKLFDGVIVMTGELADYYVRIINKSARVFLLPMTVDMDRFNIRKLNCEERYIGCVFGVHNRDCIGDTILAFDQFCQMYTTDVKLKLVGDFDGLKDRPDIELILYSVRHRDKIEFLGKMNSNDIVGFIINSDALISTPRFYESGGFPTKLGEYLASGNPVLITRVGEIANFLTETECFFANPGSIADISNQIHLMLLDKNRSEIIGRNGRKKANAVFNATTYVGELIKFLGKH